VFGLTHSPCRGCADHAVAYGHAKCVVYGCWPCLSDGTFSVCGNVLFINRLRDREQATISEGGRRATASAAFTGRRYPSLTPALPWEKPDHGVVAVQGAPSHGYYGAPPQMVHLSARNLNFHSW